MEIDCVLTSKIHCKSQSLDWYLYFRTSDLYFYIEIVLYRNNMENKNVWKLLTPHSPFDKNKTDTRIHIFSEKGVRTYLPKLMKVVVCLGPTDIVDLVIFVCVSI